MAEDLDLQFNYNISDYDNSNLEISFVNGCELSTVKLPVSSYPDGVWETCIFYPDDTNQVLKQYTSEEDARAGHRKIVDDMIAELLLNPESKQ